jgi:xanthine dehydrogenase accessory factor
VEGSLGPLLPLFERERAAGRALSLGMLVHTAGSTYRKAGALILIATNGEYAGLISGGCLEGDLREHARAVIADGTPRTVRYDMRGEEEALWGLGLGCEGAMDILLLRVSAENGWQPLAYLASALAAHQPTAVGVVVESELPQLPSGTLALPAGGRATTLAAAELAAAELAAAEVDQALTHAAADGQSRWVVGSAWKLFVMPLSLPPRILLLGAGPDAVPVVAFAALLDWKVTLVDHRAAYAVASHFPAAERVLRLDPEQLVSALDLKGFSAAVVMSHYLPSDLAYLRVLAATSIPYVGLLGPAVRRERLLGELGADARTLKERLHAPVGLPLGGRTPESIALAIVAELHAFVHASDPHAPAAALHTVMSRT